MNVEPSLRKAPQPYECAVVEGELALAVEDRDGCGELVERVGMRIDVLLQSGFGIGQIGHVGCRTYDAVVRKRRIGECKRAALSANDRVALGFERAPFRTRGRCQIAVGFFERGLCCDGGIRVGLTGGGEPRVVAPDESPCRIPEPHRDRNRIEHGAEICRARGRTRLDPDGGHRADRPTAQDDGTFALVAYRQQKGRAAVAECVQRLCKLGRIGSRKTGFDDPVGSAITARQRFVSTPGDQRVPTRGDQRVARADGGAGERTHLAQLATQAAGYA